MYRAPAPVTACPRCQRALEERRTDYESMIILGCPSCGGVWLDTVQANAVFKRGLDERALVKGSEAAAQLSQLRPVPDGVARCPIGGEEMILCEAEGVRIDQCPHHGTWFDAHEVRSIVDAADQPSALRAFLTRVLWGNVPGFSQ